MSKQYDFDTVHPRQGTQSMKWDKYGGDDVIPVWVADMDFAIAPEIHKALSRRLEHPVFGYTRASDELVKGVVEQVDSQYGWQISEDWICWIPGVVSALAASVRAYARPGSEILINTPIYHHFFQAHDPQQNTLVKVPLCKNGARWTYDLDAMSRLITQDTSVVMLCSPHNPTGTVFSSEELNAVCDMATAVGAVVVSDEIHCGLVLDKTTKHVPTALASPHNNDSIVTLMSVSKTFNLAGLNCSYVIIPNEELRAKHRAACAEIVPMTGTLALTAAEAALLNGEPWRKELISYLWANYQWLKTELDSIPGLNLQPLQATYLAWIDATELGLNDTTGFFEQRGVGFSSGEQFGQPQHLRLNFACPRSTLEEVVKRIRGAVDSLEKV